MIAIAVTGGIGSGKSTVCGILESKGFPVYDSDSAAKRLYENDDSLLDNIEEAFGRGVRHPDGRFDKGKLADIAFSSDENLAKLNSIVHPAVLRDFVRWKAMNESNGEDVVVMESALIMNLPEFMEQVDKVILVDAPLGVRLERASGRDNVSRTDIIRRIAFQKFDVSKADAIIRNAGTYEELEKEVDKALKILNVK